MKLSTFICVLVIGVVAVQATNRETEAERNHPGRKRAAWNWNGCHIEATSESVSWAKQQSIVGCDWNNPKLWGFLMKMWHWMRRDKPHLVKEWRMYEGDCKNGERDRVCVVCNGANDMNDCFDKGRLVECDPGQDACVVETDDSGKIYRRCGHKCECINPLFRDPSLREPKNHKLCSNAGCEAWWGCKAVGCQYDADLVIKNSLDRNQPANAGFEKDGTPCRCDPGCLNQNQGNWSNPAGDHDPRPCCSDLCDECGHRSPYDQAQCFEPTTTTPMMMMMGGGGGD